MMKGGRIAKALPALTELTVATQLLGAIAEDERERAELDPHHAAIWEQTDEGRKAIDLANKRLRQQIAPRNTREAGWG